MLKSFFSRPNVLFRLLVVLVFAGGLVFAGTFDGFAPKTQTASCSGGIDTAPTDEPIEQPEASCCCGSGTYALLADGTAGQPEISLSSAEEINNTLAGQSKANPMFTCGCNHTGCPTTNCSKGCSDVPSCEDSCLCSNTRCSGRHCSTYGRCGDCDGSAPPTSS